MCYHVWWTVNRPISSDFLGYSGYQASHLAAVLTETMGTFAQFEPEKMEVQTMVKHGIRMANKLRNTNDT